MDVDPVEKKPLYHFLPGSDVFSIGTAGCNLDCNFCQNHALTHSSPDDLPQRVLDPEHIVAAAKANECRSIAFTYNEPTVFAEYMMDVADAAVAAGVHTIAVTNGFITRAAVRDVYRKINAANVDIKSFDGSFYREYCKGSLTAVLNAIVAMADINMHIEITTMVIPGINDTEKLITNEALWIRDNLGMDTPLHLTAFHPAHKLTGSPRTPVSLLEDLAVIARAEGLRYVYVGNAESESNHTWCPKCKRRLVERRGLEMVSMDLTADGTCPGCGAEIPIILS
jgi:pyruvate formate lyase activating enzyme